MENREQWVMIMATSVSNGDWVSYSTEKGRYVGKVESVRTTEGLESCRVQAVLKRLMFHLIIP